MSNYKKHKCCKCGEVKAKCLEYDPYKTTQPKAAAWICQPCLMKL